MYYSLFSFLLFVVEHRGIRSTLGFPDVSGWVPKRDLWYLVPWYYGFLSLSCPGDCSRLHPLKVSFFLLLNIVHPMQSCQSRPSQQRWCNNAHAGGSGAILFSLESAFSPNCLVEVSSFLLLGVVSFRRRLDLVRACACPWLKLGLWG